MPPWFLVCDALAKYRTEPDFPLASIEFSIVGALVATCAKPL